jgi:serine/threonine protein kinase
MVIPGLAGRWRIERELGSGSFGTTFLARPEAPDDGPGQGGSERGRPVALKQLRIDRMDDWKALELFEREARVLATVAHPRIPRYHDFFAFDGAEAQPAAALAEHPRPASLVLVQDYIEGQTLGQAADAGVRFDAAAIERMLRDLLEVLDYLHTLHPPVIHRDVKPENVVLDALGTAHLVDFGAIQARLASPGRYGSTTVGTLGYAPLEQIMGQAQPASDLYALAMTVMTTITHAAGPDALPIHPATSKVDVRAASPHLPAHLARTLDGMLEPAVGARLPSARAALAELDGQRWQRGTGRPHELPVAVADESPDPLRWVWRASVGLGVVGACVVYGLFFDSLSETELMEIAPVWIAAVAFGLVGSKSRRTRGTWSRLGVAAGGAVAALAGLAGFFTAIWPSL